MRRTSYNSLCVKRKIWYDLNSSIQKMDNRYAIYIQSNSLSKLRDIVNKYIISSMKYKIGY